MSYLHKKRHENGYDLEEQFFHLQDQELIEKIRSKKKKSEQEESTDQKSSDQIQDLKKAA